MMRVGIRGGVAALGTFIAWAWAAAPATAEMQNAEANWEAMAKCAAIADDVARHECSDGVLRRAGLLAKPAEPTVSRSVEPAPAAAPVARAAPRAVAPEQTQSAAAEPADPNKNFGLEEQIRIKEDKAKDNQIEVTLQAAAKGPDGKLVLTTVDGAVWRQLYTDSSMRVPDSGDVVKIKKNTLGGFMCRIGKAPSFRCKRSS